MGGTLPAPSAQEIVAAQSVGLSSAPAASSSSLSKTAVAVQPVTYQWATVRAESALPDGDFEYRKDPITRKLQVRQKLGPLVIDDYVEDGGTALGYFCKHLFWQRQLIVCFDHHDPGRKGDVEHEMREALEQSKPTTERRCAHEFHLLFTEVCRQYGADERELSHTYQKIDLAGGPTPGTFVYRGQEFDESDFYQELDKMAKAADRSRWDFIGELALAATTWGGPEEGPLAVKQYGDENSIQSIQSLSRRSGTTGGSSRTAVSYTHLTLPTICSV